MGAFSERQPLTESSALSSDWSIFSVYWNMPIRWKSSLRTQCSGWILHFKYADSFEVIPSNFRETRWTMLIFLQNRNRIDYAMRSLIVFSLGIHSHCISCVWMLHYTEVVYTVHYFMLSCLILLPVNFHFQIFNVTLVLSSLWDRVIKPHFVHKICTTLLQETRYTVWALHWCDSAAKRKHY